MTRFVIVAARFAWKPADPEIVSDVLFAVANVLSIARTTYLMPAFEVLGPLQISLGRMIGDITRFLVLFTLVWTHFDHLNLQPYFLIIILPPILRQHDYPDPPDIIVSVIDVACP